MSICSPFKRLLLFAGLLFSFIYTAQAAENSEASRILVHTLNYMSRDYPNGIANGKIINKEEYEEMLGFCASADKYYIQFAPNWPADSQLIGQLIHRTDSLIYAKAPFADVAAMANTAKAEVVKASGLTIAPTKYPSIINGKAVFMAQCAKCHGNNGLGDGKEGLKLDPRPRNFHDDSKMSLMSPFTIYNTVRCGVQGTGMKPHPDLTDEEVWDAAFYVLTLRYQEPKGNKEVSDKMLKERFPLLELPQIATLSDKEIAETYKASKNELATLRYSQPNESRSRYIEAALKYMDEALLACREGNYEAAEKLSNMSYLEGIEPIEKQLRSTDPGLMERLEDQMANTRKIILDRKDIVEISDSLKASKVLITQAGEAIDTTQMSFWLAIMMSISILLREGLEAFLVIMVILGIINASGVNTSKKYIHAGWITAILSGVVLWIIAGRIIEGHREQVELMEGVIALVAVAMLLYIGFWLHGKSEATKWKAYVSEKVKNVTGTNSLIGLFALSFFVVFREVFESVLFLSTINIESAGKQEKAILLGVFIAFVIVVSLAWIILRFSAKIPIPKLFKISSLVMGALAVILAGKGIHSFQETGFLPIHGLNFFPHIELLGIFPTIETLTAQIAVLILVIYVMKFLNGAKKK